VTLESMPQVSGTLAAHVTLNVSRRAISDVVSDIATQAHISFVADRALVGMGRLVTLRAVDITAREALLRTLAGSPLRALVGPGDQVVIVTRTASRNDNELPASERVRLSGYVRSAASQEVIRHALISADGDIVRRESNEDGFYFLNLTPGVHLLRVRAIGFVPLDTTVTLTGHGSIDVKLQAANVQLSTVTVVAARDTGPDLDVRAPDMSTMRLDLATLRLAPAMLGEMDPMRSLTLLPGVSTASDATTSFSVRGGGTDQNLILLDESTIYNPSHVLGFLSVFNSDAIDAVTLYKGAIPARFGGRLSSVVDIRQREGNGNKIEGKASIGLLASRASVEGPLPKHIGSFIVAARRSYADLFLKASKDTSLQNTVAYFYDINAKANIRLGSHGVLMASGYAGRDRFGDAEFLTAGWGNTSGTLRWNQIVGGRLYSKVTAAVSDYDYRLSFPLVANENVNWLAGIRSVSIKTEQTFHFTDRNKLEFGVEVGSHEFHPGSVSVDDTSDLAGLSIETRHGIGSAAYLGHDVELGSKLSLRYGLRFSQFTRRGKATIYKYANNLPLVYDAVLGRYEPAEPIDSTQYAAGKTVSSYSGLEPRFSASVALTERVSVKASYARTRQYLQLASRTNSPTPLDVWEPVGPFIRPQEADQFAIGVNSASDAYEFSAEAYYKKARNVVDFVDGADVVLNDRLETVLTQGEGRAYGLELFARRRTGRLSGWVSYTLAHAEQRFVAPTSIQGSGAGINGGRYYPAPYDKTHSLSVVAAYPVGRGWTFGSTFTLASGLPTTLPASRYQLDDLLIAEYGDRNAGRLPLYHRLDLSMTRKVGRGELQLGVFNAYNRFNAQSLTFRQSQNNPLISEGVQLSVFGVVPSISYSFRF
ncbi:MAG: TonB-dependent receptor, partial [Gemmatimonas sp.]